jgi:hypothetical protein
VRIVIDPGGTCRCLYDEQIDLAAIGQLCIDRASHVEPNEAGQWWADMSPVAGPGLGPFALRSDALAAEAAWLEEHRLLPSQPPPTTGQAPT